MLDRGRFHVVESAETPGALDGCVYLEPRPALAPPRLYLGLLSVAIERQGSGLGRSLLELGERYARDCGLSVVELWVVNLRQELLSWYRRRGYVRVETRPFEQPSRQLRECHFVVLHKPI